MEDKKVNELVLKIEAFIEQIKNDKESSIQFLQSAGIIDIHGELQERYKELCTPPMLEGC